MTPAIRYTLLSIGICALFAPNRGLITGSGLETWYSQLQQPSFGLSMEGWILVAFLYYLVCGIVLYRLFRVSGKPGKPVMLIMFLGMMLLNEGWNYTFFGMQSPATGFFCIDSTAGIYPVDLVETMAVRPPGRTGAIFLHRMAAVLPRLDMEPV